MKFTIRWLEKFLDLNGAKVEEIVEALTNLGLEVESVATPSPLLKQFIVAKVVECGKHPNADKLSVCSVSDGENILNIVCGAPNVRAGLKIVFAPIGSVIPTNEMKIKRAKLRGVESEGMICSSAELGLGEDSDGIMELDENLKVGERFVDQCPWTQDIVIDIAITPNRADCLGIYNIARDLAAYGIGKLKALPKIKSNTSNCSNSIAVEISNDDACPLFIGRYFKDIDNLKQTPLWLKTTLNSIGEKSISPIVDITNYINYSFGRPLHAFDADKLEGKLQVRLARRGEEMLSLSEDKIELEEQDIIIADDRKLCALAGIIGGESSKCSSETKNIFLEAAVFDQVRIAKTGQRTKINSNSKYRFERGVDYDFTLQGMEIATEMINEICGGEAGDLVIVGNTKSKQRSIDFDLNLILKLSGTVIKTEKIKSILEKLGFEIKNTTGDKIKVIVPSWRNDVTISEDLVEEVLRINGYNNIPTIPITTTKTINTVPIPQSNTLDMRAKVTLAALGFDEMITWSFMSSKIAEKFELLDKSPTLTNPISADLDVMRVSLLPNLLSCVHKNNARGFNDLSLFEIGNVFENKNFSQTKMLCALRSGKTSEENIFKDSRNVDFFDLKSDLLTLLENVFNIDPEEINFTTSKELPHWYHPAKSAVISIGKEIIGYVGEIHPSILKSMDLSGPTATIELFANKLPFKTKEKNVSLSDYQIVSRDFAFVIDKNIPSSELTKAVSSINNVLIKDIHVFDLFTGPAIGENKKSIALRVKLQAADHSLTEEEISIATTQIIDIVRVKTGGVLRETITK
jgi:phenylalanyl-tRNA synthetase beta chain